MGKVNCVALIDDNEADNFLHKIILERSELCNEIIQFSAAIDALKFLVDKTENELPDLIFLDLNMPKMNGWEFLEALKKSDIHSKKDIQIYILTTSENPDDVAKAANYDIVKGLKNKPLSKELIESLPFVHS